MTRIIPHANIKNQMSKRLLRVEYSAGGIVFRRTPNGPEIAFISDSYKKWTFPKGRIKSGESVAFAAVRESEEELGLKGLRPLKRLGGIDIWFVDRYERKDDLVHKFIEYVLLQAPLGAQLKKPSRPKRGEIIHGVRWVHVSQALQFSNYKDVKPVLKRAIDILGKQG